MNTNSTAVPSNIEHEYHQFLMPPFGDQATAAFNVDFDPSLNLQHYSNAVEINFYGVPNENKTFVHRPTISEKMNTFFQEESSSEQCRILVLRGLGGMGKTELMLRYCYVNRHTYDYVFWLEVDGKSLAIDSFRRLAINLGLDKDIAMDKTSEGKVLEWVRNWFERRNGWLILLDSVDKTMATDIFQLLPRFGGDIIITTREHISSNNVTDINVDRMTENESLSLLFRSSSLDLISEENPQFTYCKEIITELDCIPLAINLAGAYILNTWTTFRDYLDMFEEGKKHVDLPEYTGKKSSDRYNYILATVCKLSIDNIQTLNSTAVQILEACVFLQADTISMALLQRQYSSLNLFSISSKPASLHDRKRLQQDIQTAIEKLEDFSFSTRTLRKFECGERDLVYEALKVHRSVQKSIYDMMSSEKRLEWAQKISTALKDEIDLIDWYLPQISMIMDTHIIHIRHFVAILDNLKQKPLISNDLWNLLIDAVEYLIDVGNYSDAEKFAQYSVIISETINGVEHPYTARALSNLTTIYMNKDENNMTETHFRRALAIHENELGSEHPNTIKYLACLAVLCHKQHRYDEAEQLYQRVLAIRENVLGPEHQDIARILKNLACLYSDQRQYNKAEQLYQQALKICEKTLGPAHPDTVTSLKDLASVYKIQNQYAKAVPLYQRVVSIRENVMGPTHSETAKCLSDLAALYMNQGQYHKAKELYQRALAIHRITSGLEHPRTAMTLHDLATLYYNQRKYSKAKPLYQRALAIRLKKFGLCNPQTAMTQNDLATLYHDQNKYAKAEPLYEQALDTRKTTLGLEDPQTVKSLSALARVYAKQRKYNMAEPLYKQALAIREKKLEPDHLHTAKSLISLARLYDKQSQYEKAEPLYQRSLEIREKVLGSDHPLTIEARKELQKTHQNINVSRNDFCVIV